MTWLPGFFTGRLHAVADLEVRLVFHSVPIVWALCGVPVALLKPDDTLPLCVDCLARANAGQDVARNGGSGRGSGSGAHRPSMVR
jgi:hypothetical protein